MPSDIRFATAVEILVRLARTDGFKTSEELGKMIGIHAVAIRRVIARLGDAGIIKTQRGFRHGSQMIRSPHSITLGDIHRALGLPGGFSAGAATGGQLDRLNAQLSSIYSKCFNAFEAELDLITLASVLESAK
jgi:DNA-binding IscR family transcriptional regulator